ncbi:MAG: urease accessory protein UreE [Rikenellaceae bacterium]
MLIREITGNRSNTEMEGLEIDTLHLEWYELNKRVQRKVSSAGRDVALKFTSEGVMLGDGDILYLNREEGVAIVVVVDATQAILLSPQNMLEMATVCYEIGNKHMPLFIDGDEILLPYEAPMFKWLEAAGYAPQEVSRKLLNRLKSKSSDHHHSHHEEHHKSLFTKVINFASKASKDE